MLGVSIFGSGRMGDIYAKHATANPDVRLVSIVNPNLDSARRLAQQYGARSEADPAAALADPDVDAVIIATPTSTHLEMIEMVAAAGKPILCEKPLDLAIDRVDRCIDFLAAHPVPFMLAFNRRFDPGIAALKRAVQAGEAGKPHLVLLTSRDPAPPPISYVEKSGGYFADSTIHDIDLACWICGEYPTEVFAAGSCLVDPKIGEAGDVDTTMTTLRMPSGCLVHVNNSRQAVYGFDQRIEVFGPAGMIQTANQREDNLVRWTAGQTDALSPLKYFFLERYDTSFAEVLRTFASSIDGRKDPPVTAVDGRLALAITNACEKSRRNGRAEAPDYGAYLPPAKE